jgi:hypothetical protein
VRWGRSERSEFEDLKSRIDALENFSVKHFTRLYVAIEPAKVAEVTEHMRDMRAIYRNPTSPKEGQKPPAPEGGDERTVTDGVDLQLSDVAKGRQEE